MRKSRFSDEQIIAVVREGEAGAKVDELCRRHGITPQTFYRWKNKFGGMTVPEAKRLKALLEENHAVPPIPIGHTIVRRRPGLATYTFKEYIHS